VIALGSDPDCDGGRSALRLKVHLTAAARRVIQRIENLLDLQPLRSRRHRLRATSDRRCKVLMLSLERRRPISAPLNLLAPITAAVRCLAREKNLRAPWIKPHHAASSHHDYTIWDLTIGEIGRPVGVDLNTDSAIESKQTRHAIFNIKDAVRSRWTRPHLLTLVFSNRRPKPPRHRCRSRQDSGASEQMKNKIDQMWADIDQNASP
jgi:hypothetical protein